MKYHWSLWEQSLFQCCGNLSSSSAAELALSARLALPAWGLSWRYPWRRNPETESATNSPSNLTREVGELKLKVTCKILWMVLPHHSESFDGGLTRIRSSIIEQFDRHTEPLDLFVGGFWLQVLQLQVLCSGSNSRRFPSKKRQISCEWLGTSWWIMVDRLFHVVSLGLMC